MICQLLIIHHHKSGDHIIVSAQIFRPAVHHNIRSQGNRLLEIGSQERIIHHQQSVMLPGNGGELSDIRHLHHRIGRSLHKQHFRRRTDSGLNSLGICHVHIGKHTAQLLKDILPDTEGAPVDIIGEQHMIPRLQNAKYRHIGSLSAGEGKACQAAFQNCHGALQFLPGRILQTGIGIPGRHIKIPVHKRSRLKNRKTYRSRNGIAAQGSVDYLGIKM